MLFGTVDRMGPGMRQVVKFWDRSTGGGNFWSECGAPYCNQWGVSGVAVRKCLNRRYGVVRGVGRGIGGDAACCQITLGNFVFITAIVHISI